MLRVVYLVGMKRARGVVALLVVLFAGDARADERVECAKAYEQTQRLRQKNELLSALDDAHRCARPTCPELLRKECTQWSSEIEAKLPRLTARVRGADGCFRRDPIIEVSGAHRAMPDGNVALDPGVHELRVVDSVSGSTKTQTIDFAEGERRDIDFDFAPPDLACGATAPPPPPPPPPSRQIPTTSIVLGAVGGGLLLTGMTLGIIGAVKRGDLNDCKPNCSSDRIDGVRTFFVAGDVIGGLGLLTLGAGVAVYFLAGRETVTGAAF
jgi:hypothetical protein